MRSKSISAVQNSSGSIQSPGNDTIGSLYGGIEGTIIKNLKVYVESVSAGGGTSISPRIYNQVNGALVASGAPVAVSAGFSGWLTLPLYSNYTIGSGVKCQFALYTANTAVNYRNTTTPNGNYGEGFGTNSTYQYTSGGAGDKYPNQIYTSSNVLAFSCDIDISDSIVATGMALQTTGASSGRRLVSLSNGWLILAVKNTSSSPYTSVSFYKSADNGATWTLLTSILGNGSPNFGGDYTGITSSGTTVYCAFMKGSDSAQVQFVKFDATTVGSSVNTSIVNVYNNGSNQNQGTDSYSIKVNGSTVHIVWSGYYSGSAVLYIKSIDGGATWGSITVVANSSVATMSYSSMSLRADGNPVLVNAWTNNSGAYEIQFRYFNGTTWNATGISMGSFVTIKGSLVTDSSGVIHAVWQGLASGSAGQHWIHYTKSTDNGTTWSTFITLAPALSTLQNPVISVDNINRLYVFFEGYAYNSVGTQVQSVMTVYNGSSWSTPKVVSTGANPTVMERQANGIIGFASKDTIVSNDVRFDKILLNSAPNAPTITSPTHNQALNTRTPTITWNFSDPDVEDTQSAYYIEVWNAVGNTILWVSGWLSGSSTSYTLPAGVITADGNWNIQVYLKDLAGVQAGSGLRSFSVDTVPPTIGGITPYTYVNTTATKRFTITGVTDAIGVGVVHGYVSDTAIATWYGPVVATNAGGGSWYFDVTSAMWSGQGTHVVRFWVYDLAGNGTPLDTQLIYDSITPTVPTQTNGTLYATSNGVSWSSFSDGAASSGRNTTTLHLQSYNGSTWSNVGGFPLSVGAVSSYSFTGLTPATQYRWGVIFTDNANNANVLSYTTFTTNSYAISTILNLASNGYLFNQKPKVKFSVTDANNATLTNFQIQISTVNTFTSTLLDTTSGANASGWGATVLSSGATNSYTPQSSLGTGTFYVRARAHDGIEWGTWSTTVSFTINAATWPTTISDTDTAISKGTVDSIRTAVNNVRQSRGLATINWTDVTINDWNHSSRTAIRAVHLTELRQAIGDIYLTQGLSVPAWTDTTILTSSTPRKGKHWSELRSNLIGI